MHREARHGRGLWRRNRYPEGIKPDPEWLMQRLETAFFQIRFPTDMQDF
jgi:hypothetical protein